MRVRVRVCVCACDAAMWKVSEGVHACCCLLLDVRTVISIVCSSLCSVFAQTPFNVFSKFSRLFRLQLRSVNSHPRRAGVMRAAQKPERLHPRKSKSKMQIKPRRAELALAVRRGYRSGPSKCSEPARPFGLQVWIESGDLSVSFELSQCESVLGPSS